MGPYIGRTWIPRLRCVRSQCGMPRHAVGVAELRLEHRVSHRPTVPDSRCTERRCIGGQGTQARGSEVGGRYRVQGEDSLTGLTGTAQGQGPAPEGRQHQYWLLSYKDGARAICCTHLDGASSRGSTGMTLTDLPSTMRFAGASHWSEKPSRVMGSYLSSAEGQRGIGEGKMGSGWHRVVAGPEETAGSDGDSATVRR